MSHKKFQIDFNGTEKKFCIEPIHKDKVFIYALLDENENVLFVGQTKNPHERAFNLFKDKKFSFYKFFECDPSKASEIVLSLYDKYKPPLNLTIPIDPNYCSLDNFKKKNRQLSGKIKLIRSFLRDNPCKTLAGLYPIKYLKNLLKAVSDV